METIKLTINQKEITASQEESILEICQKHQISIPTLCHHPDLRNEGNCRLCVVEVAGEENLTASCNRKACDGMVVETESEKVIDSRRATLELLIANHPNDCLTCDRTSGECQLQDLCYQYDISRGEQLLKTIEQKKTLDLSSPSIERDLNKCIVCGKCLRVCGETQDIGIYHYQERGFDTLVSTKENQPLAETKCINCGQCVKVCPVGALVEKQEIRKVMQAIADPEVHVVVQTAPAVKHTLGESFGMKPGTDISGKLNAALKKLGVNQVFSTDFAADVTIMEEGTEFIQRVKNGGKLPMFTSCSPGWIRYVETEYPQFTENLSTCKSPQQMMGALSKSYYASLKGIDPKKIFMVSVMPCTAKKYEAQRDEMAVEGIQDVDAVLTTRELARWIKLEKIAFKKLKDTPYDDFLGEHTSAGRLFGTTGGVMEAALRTVAWTLTEGAFDRLDYEAVRGLENVKEASLEIAGMEVRVAVVHGTAAAKKLLQKIESGEKNYHFVEVMGCPGGCINGGGAPLKDSMEIVEKRMKGMYQMDKEAAIRRSHENPLIMEIYHNYLGEPGGHKAHELLHTH
ncbi:NAD(P)-dependent iron-only hydrogenase catalytic subunit [Tindallia magadiensis]|uniref:NAD(P)-dependent iron-only hydrogenase catalytic subunit n=1 Tax=Tindallia magadiensis TaxID=69895 RepID=A0A1I3BU40_9FIRM|nr:NADH-dependent [FeFe] hydrogenase, group A6 [Tindallia magadiensis]SFH65828.1 NAD(P)-dependent iron-only hydrogenase catalytic subunit [Tindallia magadiensis]